jgi:hypothetical protein
LQQLLARAIVVPGPVAFDDFDQLGGRLMVARIGRGFRISLEASPPAVASPVR